ncbi:LOB DOMAIN-CONTAINING PROTEIN [Quillaja saponaria]|uniref:LOB DOMAIN-CONTAINING PROTEIN n=1 Tax=Quillaja saponaria TaxID=32244 RepID=A0AAD7LL08_QUISA|nr:LOB DOMAIN-CONTAINING PROTEIN [Quillaja saponaria]
MSKDREILDEIGKRNKREAAEAPSSQNQMGRRHIYDPISGSNLNRVTPCAACKLLRRKCAEECPFSPYFSPHEPQKFAAVHKVFGASNVSKMLMEVTESQRLDAANSLVYEANLRLRDPVYGSMGAILALQQQVQSLQAEINAVRAEIMKYKLREAATHHQMISSHHATLVISSGDHQAPKSVDPQSQLLPSLPPSPPPPPPPPPPPIPPSQTKLFPPPSVVLSPLSSTSTTSSSINTTGHGSISSNHNVPYFD